MTTTDYRAFGECQKTILTNGQSIDLTATPQTFQGTPAAFLYPGYKFMHVLPLVSSNVTVGLAFDTQAATTYTVTTSSQIVGVNKITVITGTVEVFLFL